MDRRQPDCSLETGSTLDSPVECDEESQLHKPTFYLGGQAYIFNREEMLRGGSDLACMAIIETYRQLTRLWLSHHGHFILPEEAHVLTEEEMLHRMAELQFGIWELMTLADMPAPLSLSGSGTTMFSIH